MEPQHFFSSLAFFTNQFSKQFLFITFLHKNKEISEREKNFLKDLVIMENDEFKSAFESFEISQDLEKLRASLKPLLRFLKVSELSMPKSPLSVKVPLCRQLSFYSQIPSPCSRRGSSPTNSPTKSCSPRWTSRMSIEDIGGKVETLRLKNLEMDFDNGNAVIFEEKHEK